MPSLRNILDRFVRNDSVEYELVASDGHSPRASRRHYRPSLHVLKHLCAVRNILIAIPTIFVLIVCAILLNGGVPPLYANIREYERHFPQHNTTFSHHANIKYLAFPDHIWGHGWNNVLQEYIMLSYLASITNRSFVFEDYTWSHLPFPYTLYDFALRPARIPLNSFIAGPIAGGPISSSSSSTPRAIAFDFWKSICPPDRRRVVSSVLTPSGLKSTNLIQWWKDTIANEDAPCLEIDMSEKTIFEFDFFSGRELLDVWPSLSQNVVITQFKWSPLVLSAVQRNFVILPDIRDGGTTVLRRHFLGSLIHDSPIPRASSVVSAAPPTHTYPGLLALHIRRGDFKRHCPRLAGWNNAFHGFNSFEGLPDRWKPYDNSSADSKQDKIEYYRKRCFPTQEEIVERLRIVRNEYDAFVSQQRPQRVSTHAVEEDISALSPIHQLQRVFVLTNAWSMWLDGLKRQLIADGWEDVFVSGDLALDKEQKGVDVAVDMSIAEKAEVFVGNGFSSLSGNIVMLRTGQGLHAQTNRFL